MTGERDVFRNFYYAGADGCDRLFGRFPRHFVDALLRTKRLVPCQPVLDSATGAAIAAEAPREGRRTVRLCGRRCIGVSVGPGQIVMKSPKTTEVCITIDTEFSIGGNFSNPNLSPVAEPIVLGAIDGKEHGLGFLLDVFFEFGVRATFFVEALQTAYFGDEPMGRIAKRIAKAGQDVQLHLHPCWLHYEATSAPVPSEAPSDSCAGRSDAQLDHFFQFGFSVFSRWGLSRPVAVRSGNFQVDTNFYRAAARSGILLSSSIALPVHRPADEALARPSSRHRIGQVLEFPVFSYTYPLGLSERSRPLAITACSCAEILSVLWQAHNHGISPVIILTHPQEYIKRKDFRYTTLRRNRVNQTRLKTVLQFLSQNKDKFAIVPIPEISDDDSNVPGSNSPAISVSSRQALGRMLSNSLNDLVWWY